MPAWSATTCSTTIAGNDAMQFDTKAIVVPKGCKQFTVTLKHTGKLPKGAMGHDWVLSRAADEPGVLADGAKAGPGGDYLKPGDSRVLAHTRLLGGGESDAVTFKTPVWKAGEAYVFYCTFPGHSALMNGTLTLAR
jgi:azurin